MNYNPIHPHCGPFNKVSANKPRDPIDAICWIHDTDYARLLAQGKNPYGPDGLEADKKMIEALPANVPGMTYGTLMKVKVSVMKAYAKVARHESKAIAKDPRFQTMKAKVKHWRRALEFNQKMQSYNRKRLYAGFNYQPSKKLRSTRSIYMSLYRPMWKRWSRRRRYYRGRRRR